MALFGVQLKVELVEIAVADCDFIPTIIQLYLTFNRKDRTL